MSDAIEVDAVPEGGPTGSPGALLRQAREASGLHIGALAVALKVPVRKLEALESDRWDQLPDTVFVRALANSVCRVLKVDPTPVLACMPKSRKPALLPADPMPDQVGASLASTDRSLRLADGTGSTMSRPRWWMLIALGILGLGVAAVVLLNPSRVVDTGSVRQVPATAPSQWTPSDAVLPPTPNPTPQASSVVTSGVGEGTPVSTGAAPSVGATGVGSETTLNPLVFRARGPTWIEVTDARGVVQTRKTLSAGEVLGVGGIRPLSVVIGRADMTDVEVMGSKFDLSPHVRDQVARFDVQ